MSYGLNAEIYRRAVALLDIAVREGHTTLRIASGWRSDKTVYDAFFHRYSYVGPDKPEGHFLDGHLKQWHGDDIHPAGWYVLKPGQIPSATPGNSYHGTMQPDALTGDMGAVAIDWDDEDDFDWLQANARRVGLRASKLPGERHHTDPLEYPPARADFNLHPDRYPLTIWPIKELDMMQLIQVGDPVTQHATDRLVLTRDGIFVTHTRNPAVVQFYIDMKWVDPKIEIVPRIALSGLFGQGTFPVYDPIPTQPDVTLITDFAGWRL